MERILFLVRTYYWGTPVFLVLDLLFGVNIRVSAFIYHPFYKAIYYLFCFICLSVVVWKPGLTSLVGVIESSISVAILSIGMMLAVWGFGMPSEDHLVFLYPLRTQNVINFILSGGICCFSFYGYLDKIHIMK